MISRMYDVDIWPVEQRIAITNSTRRPYSHQEKLRPRIRQPGLRTPSFRRAGSRWQTTGILEDR